MTTKVKVKKTRAERKQHSRDMQAKHEAEKKAANLRNILKRDILATLGIPKNRHCCKVSDEAAFCLIQRPYISKTLLTRRISPRGSP